MDIKEINRRIQDRESRIAAIQTERTLSVPEELNAISALLTENQEIWIQGSTPSFNDGDPCYHSQSVCQMASEDDDYYEGVTDYHELKCKDESLLPLLKLCEAMESDLESVFGTNWQIHITPKGYTKEDWYEGY